MRLGLWLMPLHPLGREPGEVLAENTEKALLADALGFDELWVGEHLSSATQPIPAPLAFLASLVSRTRLRLGTAAINLPFHHPAIVAAEAAQLDQMSGGRLELGVGPGSLVSDAALFRLPDAASRARRTVEAAAQIAALWTLEPPFDLQGEFWNLRLVEGAIPGLGIGSLPRPRQRPGPPISLTAASPASPSARTAGRRGWGVLSGHTVAVSTLASHWEAYRAGCAEVGGLPRAERWRVARSVLVATTDARAEERLRDARGALRAAYEALHAAQVALGMPAPASVDSLLAELPIHGSPRTVVERLVELRREAGPFGTLLVTAVDWSGPNRDWDRESLRLLARKVMPALRRLAGEPPRRRWRSAAKEATPPAPTVEAAGDGPVLLVSHDLSLSGAPRVLLHLGELLRRAGVEVHLARFRPEEHPEMTAACTAAGIARVPLPDPAAPAELRRYTAIVVNTVVVAPWLRALLDGGDEDLAARLVGWIHEVHPPYLDPATTELMARLERIVFDSATGRERWREAGLAADGATFVHPAVPATVLAAAAAARRAEDDDADAGADAGASGGHGAGLRQTTRRALGVFPDDLVILSLGSLIPSKGVAGIVSGFERLLGTAPSPDEPVKAHLLIVGRDGHQEAQRIETMAAAIAARSSYGTVYLRPPTADTAPFYAAADVFVINTLPPGEMFGLVTIEAMAFGLPVLAPDCGGATEIVVHGETGLLHSATEPATLAANLATLYRDRTLARRLGEAGRRRVAEHFSEATMWQSWREILASAPRRREHSGAGLARPGSDAR